MAKGDSAEGLAELLLPRWLCGGRPEQLVRLREALDAEGVVVTDLSDPERGHYVLHCLDACGREAASVAFSAFTYGAEEGLLEVLDLSARDCEPQGWLTAEEAMAYIREILLRAGPGEREEG